MNVCPICLFVNTASIESCARCGRFQFKAQTATLEPPASASSLPHAGQISWGILPSPVEQSTGVVMLTPNQPLSAQAPRPSDVGSKSQRLMIKPKLEVVRGEKIDVSFPILEGRNVIGRTLAIPVDIDLTGQETPDRVWSSRQHACFVFDGRSIVLEDLNSLNGTFVNRARLAPGRQKVLQPGDVVQVGTVQLQLHVHAEKVEVIV
jgi:FHA domain